MRSPLRFYSSLPTSARPALELRYSFLRSLVSKQINCRNRLLAAILLSSPVQQVVTQDDGGQPVAKLSPGAAEGVEDGIVANASENVLTVGRDTPVDDTLLLGTAYGPVSIQVSKSCVRALSGVSRGPTAASPRPLSDSMSCAGQPSPSFRNRSPHFALVVVNAVHRLALTKIFHSVPTRPSISNRKKRHSPKLPQSPSQLRNIN